MLTHDEHQATGRGRGTLHPPRGGAVVRMYRIGHGDCFLLAFDGEEDTVFVLIDCGYKPGSSVPGVPDGVVADIRDATGGFIDVAVITHEHQDHVNAITKSRFDGIGIGETWLAWTESPNDNLANMIRARRGDRLKAVMGARARLALLPAAQEEAASIAEFLALEIGGEEAPDTMLAAFAAGQGWTNKDAMKLFRDRAQRGVRFLQPHQDILPLPGAPEIRVFPLGPPRDESKLKDLNPREAEQFGGGSQGHDTSFGFFAAALDTATAAASRPFAPAFTVPRDTLLQASELGRWYGAHYGPLPASQGAPPGTAASAGVRTAASRGAILGVVADNAESRRIETEWLLAAEGMALDMGNDTNNGSLVLAFEIGRGGKVLLFAADAQRGNWASWADAAFTDGQTQVQVKELLGRTVLYKVGHHGSHNATLHGAAEDSHPNLAWLGRGVHAEEFTAMIPAVRTWARGLKKPWDHPLPAIRAALMRKCRGRVLQTDTSIATRPDGVEADAWDEFRTRASEADLFFDYRILPSTRRAS